MAQTLPGISSEETIKARPKPPHRLRTMRANRLPHLNLTQRISQRNNHRILKRRKPRRMHKPENNHRPTITTDINPHTSITSMIPNILITAPHKIRHKLLIRLPSHHRSPCFKSQPLGGQRTFTHPNSSPLQPAISHAGNLAHHFSSLSLTSSLSIRCGSLT